MQQERRKNYVKADYNSDEFAHCTSCNQAPRVVCGCDGAQFIADASGTEGKTFNDQEV